MTDTAITEQASPGPTRGERLDQLQHRMDKLVDEHLNTIQFTEDTSSVESLAALFNYEIPELEVPPEVKVLNKQKQLKSKEYGLELEANYLQNFGGSLSPPRMEVGVEWNVLKNGWLDNKQQAQEIDNKIRMSRFRERQTVQDQYYNQLYNRFIYHFNQLKISYSRRYLDFLNSEMEIVETLHQLKYRGWENVLEIRSKRERMQNKLENFLRYNRQFSSETVESVSAANLPIVDLKLDRILQVTGSDKLQTIRQSLKKNTYNPWTDISLRTFLDYNINSQMLTDLSSIGSDGDFFQRPGNQEFFSFGLRLSVPFPLLKEEKQELRQAQHKKMLSDLESDRQTINKQIYNQYYEYQYALEDYIDLYQKYLNFNEQIRKQLVRRDLEDPQYQPGKVLQLLHSQYSVAISLIDQKQKLYLQLLRTYQYADDIPVTDLVQRIRIGDTFRKNKGDYGVYIWSSSLEQHSNAYLKHYLINHQLNTVYLSTGPDTSLYDKTRAFISEVHRSTDIRVSLMIGDNNLLFKDHKSELRSFISRAAHLGADGVHLDVEPHTFNDWEKRRDEYLRLYLQMVRNARKWTRGEGLSLSLSIPVFYTDIVKQLHKLSDQLVVMAYGVSSPEQIKGRISDIQQLIGTDFTLALRPADFGNEKELKQSLSDVQRVTEINNVMIHDLKEFMDNKQNNN